MGVAIQPSPIFPSNLKLILLQAPLAILMPITAPTHACDWETGTKGNEGRPRLINQLERSCELNK